MKFPLVINELNTLIVVKSDFFDGIGELDLNNRTLEINVGPGGEGSMKWILDADANFYVLTPLVAKPPSLLQRIGLRKLRERFRIEQERTVTAGELRDYIRTLKNKYEEAPNVSYLQQFLKRYSSEHVLTAADMREYLGI